MRRHLLGLVLALGACGDNSLTPDARPSPPDAAAPDAAPTPDIRELLEAIPGMTIVDETQVGTARFFRLVYLQPADHAQPDGASFGQRLTLLHRSFTAPTVLALNGYYLWDEPYEEEPTALLRANQIAVEHRFFTPSRPEPADWSLLTIRQAADDHHRIAETFHPIYTGAWISTGASKGGMTSVYHRRFYPLDVDGTVAYVAPISFGAPDDRYLAFFDTAGDDAACRSALISFQREALTRRAAMLTRINDQAVTGGWTYNRLGVEVAFESAVMELPFSFWQYWGITLCSDVPFPSASDDTIFAFLDMIVSVTFFSDAMVEYFEPYYYQAADELGYPSVPHALLDDLLQYELLDTIPLVIPPGSTPSYDPLVMQDVSSWVMNEGSELLFIYGEWDPWTAGAFDLGGAVDSFVLFEPAGTHGAAIYSLPPFDRSVALDALERWTGVAPSGTPAPGWYRPPPRRDLPPVP